MVNYNDSVQDVPMQPASLDIWDKKYRLKDKNGVAIDESIDDTYQRVAFALSDVEETNELREYWNEQFLWALRNGAIPAGRILSNAGAEKYKPSTSLINCLVSGNIVDSMDDILTKLHESGMSLKGGSGIGYCFSTLRPRGSYVHGAGSSTSGPLSFMDIYDKMCFTISSAGGRRGAQMGTFDVGHPDVFEFIRAKREDGRLRQFNLSLLITHEFMDAVKNDKDWKLSFPISDKEASYGEEINWDEVIFREWPITEGYITNTDGLVACKVYNTVKARDLWDTIMYSTYDYSEPGFILIDRVNELNNNWWCENIISSNPCGEQNLPPYGSCLLGSINLTQFVEHPFTDKAEFNWDKYNDVAYIFTRMLDNVVELNGLPLEKQRQEIFNKRRHGMGFLGLGSALTMLRIRYGSKESIKFTEMVSYCTAVANFQASLDLSIEKGPAPILDKMYTVTVDMLKKRPEMRIDGYCEGDMIKGSVLHAKYSLYMQKLARSNKSLTDELERVGARFTHGTSIAPTGCVDKDTLIVTNDGLKRIVEMGDATGSQWQDIDFMVSTDSGFRQATKFFVNGRKPVKTITMRSGRKFISTPNHKVRVVCPNNGYSWMSVDDLCIGMIVPSIVDDYPENVDCSKMIEFSLQDGENKRNYNLDFKSPTILTEDIAELVGFLHANGNIKTDRHMRLFHHDRYADAVFTRIEAVLLDRFNVKSSRIKDCRERAKNLSELHVYSKPLISWLSQNGLSKETSCTVSIPSRILDGGRNVIYGYLRGYFEGDGTSSVNSIAVSSTSEKLLDDMMIMMQSVGIVSSKNISLDATSDSHYGDKVVYRLSINHFIDRKRFIDRIGFLSCKNNVLHQSSRNTDRRQVTKNVLETFGCLFDRSTRKAIFSKLNEFNRLHECEFFYDEVVSIDDGFTETYDLSVPENVTYIANNLVSHNTISLSLANNASNGIEPSFSHHYSRNVIREGKKSKEKIDVFSYELLAYRHLVNQNAIPNSTCDENRLPDYFVTSDSVTPKEHIDIQAAAQRWIDSSISKTVNVPSDISYSDFKDVYLYAYEKGLKGCATFRFNPEVFQGVLVNEKDLENTTYQFKLEDGNIIEVKGNENIEYDGELHSAANLFDAIKEGYYGKL